MKKLFWLLRNSISAAAYILITIVLATGLQCIAPVVVPPDNLLSLELTLETPNRYQAEFSGTPISAIVTAGDTIDFDSLDWHWGSAGGIVIPPSSASDKPIKQVRVLLNWNRMPVTRDSVTKKMYDTLFLTTGGGLRRSNVVRVSVINLAPVLDTLKANTKNFRTTEPVWNLGVDTARSIVFGVYARDPDNNTLRVAWSAKKGDISSENSIATTAIKAVYTVPTGDFKDTVTMRLYDGYGGQVIRTINLARQGLNTAPVIDSLWVDTARFTDSRTFYQFGKLSIDTLRFVLFFHDTNNDTQVISWTLRRKSGILTGTAVNKVYACTLASGSQPLRDSALVLDTLEIMVRDPSDAVSIKRVQIYKGELNAPPVIDSAAIADTTLKGSDTLFMIGRTFTDTMALRGYGRDSDKGDTIKYSWSMRDMTRLLNAATTTARYLPRYAIARDTVTLSVTDNHRKSVRKVYIIDIKNRVPIIDSVTCADTIFKGSDTVSTVALSVGDSAAVRVFSRDPDTGDSVKITWGIRDTTRLTLKTGSRSVYLATTIRKDTVTIISTDRFGTAARRIVIFNVNNRYPLLDSIRVTGSVPGDSARTLTAGTNATVYSYRGTSGAQLTFTVHAHDLDAADSIGCMWSAKTVASLKVDSLSSFTARYLLPATGTVLDTCTVRITDRKGAMSSRRIQITSGP